MSDFKLNCCGLNCPMPIVELAKALKKMDYGQTIEVQANDPAFHADVEAFTEKMNYEITRFEEDNGVITVEILKKTNG